MHDPARTLAVLGLARLGTARLGFAPRDSRPDYGVSENGPRYAYAADYDVALYNEEEDVAATLTLEIEQGATFSHTVLYRQRNGDPVLGITEAKMQLRATRAVDGALVLTLSTEPDPGGTGATWIEGGLVVTEAEGKVEILLTPAQASAIAAGNYFYDLKVTIGSDVRRVIEGSISVDAAVTA